MIYPICGGGRIRTYSAESTGFTVQPDSPTPAHPPVENINCTFLKTHKIFYIQNEPVEGFEPPTR